MSGHMTTAVAVAYGLNSMKTKVLLPGVKLSSTSPNNVLKVCNLCTCRLCKNSIHKDGYLNFFYFIIIVFFAL